MPAHKHLIEDAESLDYLTTTGQWTKNAAEGKCFGNTETAFKAAKKEPTGKFNIVFYISQTKQIVNVNHGNGKGTETPSDSGNTSLITPEVAPVS